MNIKAITIEDFVNYKKPSMFIGTGVCDWKCCVEGGFDTSVCQNSSLAQSPIKNISNQHLISLYTNNSITQAIVIGGLEPLHETVLQDTLQFIHDVRMVTNDDIAIYTGYYPREIIEVLQELTEYENIIFKFGRYVPNRPKVHDPVLGIELASDNQYGAKLLPYRQETILDLELNKGFCPCMVNKNDNTKCCCLAFRKQKQGDCHCGIFTK